MKISDIPSVEVFFKLAPNSELMSGAESRECAPETNNQSTFCKYQNGCTNEDTQIFIFGKSLELEGFCLCHMVKILTRSSYGCLLIIAEIGVKT